MKQKQVYFMWNKENAFSDESTENAKPQQCERDGQNKCCSNVHFRIHNSFNLVVNVPQRHKDVLYVPPRSDKMKNRH